MRIVSTARHQAIPAFPARISQLPFPAVSLLFCLLLIFRQDLSAQVIAPPMGSAIQVLNTGAPRVSLRGLSVVDDKVVWVSGNSGAVGRSTDGGTTWTWIIVPGYEKRDFRDIEAFDGLTAIIMGIAEPANILKTTDGGKTWNLVYENKTPGMFLDAMEFWDNNNGIVVGDPVNGKFFVSRTVDGGNSWQDIPLKYSTAADSGEGCFASSGTNIRAIDKDEACFISGGKLRSRLFIRDKAIELPLVQGSASTGGNSVAVKDQGRAPSRQDLIVVGGDFAKDTSQEKNCYLTHDGGKTWIAPETPPHGYRSCVEYIGGDKVLSCGTSGVDLSVDNGMNWQLISKESFHVCRKAKKGKTVFLAGSGGRVAKLVL